MTSPAAARRAPLAPRPAPGLRAVPASRLAPPRLPFVLVVFGLLATGLLGLLLLNTLAAQDAFRLHDLQRSAARLSDQTQELETALAVEAAPGTLAARARALGMLPVGDATFLRLPDGRVLAAASAVPPPAPVSAGPTASPAAKVAAARAAPHSAAPSARPSARPSGVQASASHR